MLHDSSKNLYRKLFYFPGIKKFTYDYENIDHEDKNFLESDIIFLVRSWEEQFRTLDVKIIVKTLAGFETSCP